MPACEIAWSASAPQTPWIVWHPQIILPRAVMAMFMNPALYAALCKECQTLQSLKYNKFGAVRCVLCVWCRSALSRQPPYACPSCGRPRFVDGLGHAPPHCDACHKRKSPPG
jgi:hypothetical protein